MTPPPIRAAMAVRAAIDLLKFLYLVVAITSNTSTRFADSGYFSDGGQGLTRQAECHSI
jgi:hypothetical protein